MNGDSPGAAPKPESVQGRRVAVVGAGLAGLSAAYHLQRLGADVSVYEAAEGVGGRASTDLLDGFQIDFGAQFVASMYQRTRTLIDRIGLGEGLLPAEGRDALWRGGRPHEVVYGSLSSMIGSGSLPLTTKMRMGTIYVPFLRRHAAALDLTAPERAADAGLDGESIEAWGRREIDDAFVASLAYPQLAAYHGSPVEETSAGFYHILASHGLDVSLFAVAGGIGRIADRLVTRLREGGATVKLGNPVTGIELGSTVRVGTERATDTFDGIVPAIPAPLLRPLLTGAPPELETWLAKVRYAPFLAVALLLDAPVGVRYFGLSFPRGETDYLAAVTVQENKPGCGVPAGRGLLVLFPTPERVGELQTLDSEAVIDRLMPEVNRAIPATEGRISRARVYRWPIGGPLFYPGYLSRLGEFRRTEPEGTAPIAVAGDYLYGPSIEGAVVSGQEAAARLGRRLLSHGPAGTRN